MAALSPATVDITVLKAAFATQNLVPADHPSIKTPIKVSLLAVRAPGFTDAQWHTEYRVKHAQMTTTIATAIPILRGYTQSTPLPVSSLSAFPFPVAAEFDALTSLGWSSLGAFWDSLQNEEYRKSAGAHKFADEGRAVGILNSTFSTVIPDQNKLKSRKNAVLIGVLIAKGPSFTADSPELDSDLNARTAAFRALLPADGLLRYTLNKSIPVSNTKAFFKDTQFVDADFTSMAAFEQILFADLATTEAFFAKKGVKEALTNAGNSFDFSKSKIYLGTEYPLVNKDGDF